jgi:hypothetical protein
MIFVFTTSLTDIRAIIFCNVPYFDGKQMGVGSVVARSSSHNIPLNCVTATVGFVKDVVPLTF